jgi:hypothetical protein
MKEFCSAQRLVVFRSRGLHSTVVLGSGKEATPIRKVKFLKFLEFVLVCSIQKVKYLKFLEFVLVCSIRKVKYLKFLESAVEIDWVYRNL